MMTPPSDVTEVELIRSLGDNWHVEVERLDYVPRGAGSHHWRAIDRNGESHFVTVDDLDNKAWLGSGRDAAFAGLRRAFDTAVALRGNAGLVFVVAPRATVDNTSLVRLSPRYTVAMFPFLAVRTAVVGPDGHARERAELVGMLAQLHNVDPSVTAHVALHQLELSTRDRLEAALRALDTRWRAGPFSDPAREVLSANASYIIDLLERFDRLAATASKRDRALVVTHGEPHSRNVLRVLGAPRLVDWDTVALAPAERDPWMVTNDAAELARYSEATGHDIDDAALRLYRARWTLDDISLYLDVLRSPHMVTADTRRAWRSLNHAIDDGRQLLAECDGSGPGTSARNGG